MRRATPGWLCAGAAALLLLGPWLPGPRAQSGRVDPGSTPLPADPRTPSNPDRCVDIEAIVEWRDADGDAAQAEAAQVAGNALADRNKSIAADAKAIERVRERLRGVQAGVTDRKAQVVKWEAEHAAAKQAAADAQNALEENSAPYKGKQLSPPVQRLLKDLGEKVRLAKERFERADSWLFTVRKELQDATTQQEQIAVELKGLEQTLEQDNKSVERTKAESETGKQRLTDARERLRKAEAAVRNPPACPQRRGPSVKVLHAPDACRKPEQLEADIAFLEKQVAEDRDAVVAGRAAFDKAQSAARETARDALPKVETLIAKMRDFRATRAALIDYRDIQKGANQSRLRVLEGKNQEAGNQADLAQGKANEAIDAAKKAKLLLINATSDLETAEQRQADRLQALEAARASLRAVRAGTSSCPSSPQKDPRTASTTCPDCPPATEGCESPSGCPQRPNQPADQNTDSSCEGDGCKALPVIECRGGSMTGAIDCVGQKISPGR